LLSTPTIARLTINAISAEGKTFVIELEVGTPYKRETGEWACPLALKGLYDHLPEICGDDSFQALCLAIRLALEMLADFRDEGGKLLVDSDDFPLEAYAFGPASRH